MHRTLRELFLSFNGWTRSVEKKYVTKSRQFVLQPTAPG